ncbi:MAG: hypothetical protein AB7J28_08380 [Hyphomonadaceae bacterium]
MKKFVYLYAGGSAPENAEDGKAVMDAWMAYFAKMGDRIVDGGAPLGDRRSVGAAPKSASTGYSIVMANTLEEAVALTDGHPHLRFGGAIEVCETVPIGPP